MARVKIPKGWRRLKKSERVMKGDMYWSTHKRFVLSCNYPGQQTPFLTYIRRVAKSHRFVLVVKTQKTRKQAEIDVLAAFAKRDPDGCEFRLLKRG
jgi:hypothetical protein